MGNQNRKEIFHSPGSPRTESTVASKQDENAVEGKPLSFASQSLHPNHHRSNNENRNENNNNHENMNMNSSTDAETVLHQAMLMNSQSKLEVTLRGQKDLTGNVHEKVALVDPKDTKSGNFSTSSVSNVAEPKPSKPSPSSVHVRSLSKPEATVFQVDLSDMEVQFYPNNHQDVPSLGSDPLTRKQTIAWQQKIVKKIIRHRKDLRCNFDFDGNVFQTTTEVSTTQVPLSKRDGSWKLAWRKEHFHFVYTCAHLQELHRKQLALHLDFKENVGSWPVDVSSSQSQRNGVYKQSSGEMNENQKIHSMSATSKSSRFFLVDFPVFTSMDISLYDVCYGPRKCVRNLVCQDMICGQISFTVEMSVVRPWALQVRHIRFHMDEGGDGRGHLHFSHGEHGRRIRHLQANRHHHHYMVQGSYETGRTEWKEKKADTNHAVPRMTRTTTAAAESAAAPAVSAPAVSAAVAALNSLLIPNRTGMDSATYFSPMFQTKWRTNECQQMEEEGDDDEDDDDGDEDGDEENEMEKQEEGKDHKSSPTNYSSPTNHSSPTNRSSPSSRFSPTNISSPFSRFSPRNSRSKQQQQQPGRRRKRKEEEKRKMMNRNPIEPSDENERWDDGMRSTRTEKTTTTFAWDETEMLQNVIQDTSTFREMTHAFLRVQLLRSELPWPSLSSPKLKQKEKEEEETSKPLAAVASAAGAAGAAAAVVENENLPSSSSLALVDAEQTINPSSSSLSSSSLSSSSSSLLLPQRLFLWGECWLSLTRIVAAMVPTKVALVYNAHLSTSLWLKGKYVGMLSLTMRLFHPPEQLQYIYGINSEQGFVKPVHFMLDDLNENKNFTRINNSNSNKSNSSFSSFSHEKRCRFWKKSWFSWKFTSTTSGLKPKQKTRKKEKKKKNSFSWIQIPAASATSAASAAASATSATSATSAAAALNKLKPPPMPKEFVRFCKAFQVLQSLVCEKPTARIEKAIQRLFQDQLFPLLRLQHANDMFQETYVCFHYANVQQMERGVEQFIHVVLEVLEYIDVLQWSIRLLFFEFLTLILQREELNQVDFFQFVKWQQRNPTRQPHDNDSYDYSSYSSSRCASSRQSSSSFSAASSSFLATNSFPRDYQELFDSFRYSSSCMLKNIQPSSSGVNKETPPFLLPKEEDEKNMSNKAAEAAAKVKVKVKVQEVQEVPEEVEVDEEASIATPPLDSPFLRLPPPAIRASLEIGLRFRAMVVKLMAYAVRVLNRKECFDELRQFAMSILLFMFFHQPKLQRTIVETILPQKETENELWALQSRLPTTPTGRRFFIPEWADGESKRREHNSFSEAKSKSKLKLKKKKTKKTSSSSSSRDDDDDDNGDGDEPVGETAFNAMEEEEEEIKKKKKNDSIRLSFQRSESFVQQKFKTWATFDECLWACLQGGKLRRSDKEDEAAAAAADWGLRRTRSANWVAKDVYVEGEVHHQHRRRVSSSDGGSEEGGAFTKGITQADALLLESYQSLYLSQEDELLKLYTQRKETAFWLKRLSKHGHYYYLFYEKYLQLLITQLSSSFALRDEFSQQRPPHRHALLDELTAPGYYDLLKSFLLQFKSISLSAISEHMMSIFHHLLYFYDAMSRRHRRHRRRCLFASNATQKADGARDKETNKQGKKEKGDYKGASFAWDRAQPNQHLLEWSQEHTSKEAMALEEELTRSVRAFVGSPTTTQPNGQRIRVGAHLKEEEDFPAWNRRDDDDDDFDDVYVGAYKDEEEKGEVDIVDEFMNTLVEMLISKIHLHSVQQVSEGLAILRNWFRFVRFLCERSEERRPFSFAQLYAQFQTSEVEWENAEEAKAAMSNESDLAKKKKKKWVLLVQSKTKKQVERKAAKALRKKDVSSRRGRNGWRHEGRRHTKWTWASLLPRGLVDKWQQSHLWPTTLESKNRRNSSSSRRNSSSSSRNSSSSRLAFRWSVFDLFRKQTKAKKAKKKEKEQGETPRVMQRGDYESCFSQEMLCLFVFHLLLSDDQQITLVGLKFMYDHWNVWNDRMQQKLLTLVVQFCFFRLFTHWSRMVRKFFHTFLATLLYHKAMDVAPIGKEALLPALQQCIDLLRRFHEREDDQKSHKIALDGNNAHPAGVEAKQANVTKKEDDETSCPCDSSRMIQKYYCLPTNKQVSEWFHDEKELFLNGLRRKDASFRSRSRLGSKLDESEGEEDRCDAWDSLSSRLFHEGLFSVDANPFLSFCQKDAWWRQHCLCHLILDVPSYQVVYISTALEEYQALLEKDLGISPRNDPWGTDAAKRDGRRLVSKVPLPSLHWFTFVWQDDVSGQEKDEDHEKKPWRTQPGSQEGTS